VPAVDHYPLGQLIDELEGGNQQRPPGPVPMDGAPAAEVPKNWQMLKDVPLSQTAREALNVSQEWMTEKHAPAPGKDGRVLYTFGAGLPTIVCAPLRVCVLELEAGEKVIGDVTRRNLNIQPTIKVPIGYRFNVRVNRDLLFEAPYRPMQP